ncbi:hypothetical protein F5884DRAFT_758139 [Xylogone sp. PMI_703]|nr:hypothetical protein F5884DRAFT_758139 [Xylogone sp. PMI_703]
MRFSTTIPFFALAVFSSATPTPTISRRQDEKVQLIANFANQLNEDITRTTQFFEAFPTLSGSSLTTQASAAETALQDAISVLSFIALNLSNNVIVQEIKAELLDNDFLLDISFQLLDFAKGMNLILVKTLSSVFTDEI